MFYSHEILQILPKNQDLYDLYKSKLTDNCASIINKCDTLSAINKLINNDNYINKIIDLGQKLRVKFDNFVILGTGGSTLNGQAFCGTKFKQSKVHFIDNIDPNSMDIFLKELNLNKTCFLAISKSGTTLEVWTQTLAVINKLEEENINISQQLFFITDIYGNNPLLELANKLKCEFAEHPKDIGGRFATFTIVGLLPAMLCGLDIKKIIKGALSIINNYDDVISGAAFQVSMIKSGYGNNVVIPYIDRLYNFTIWFRQIWSESLGKNGQGSNPVVAQGTLDQHSQLQLYLDGPKDKIFTLILNQYKNQGMKLSNKYIPQKFDYLHNKKIGDIIVAEQEAMLQTLKDYNYNLRVFRVNDINEEVIGSLMMHYMLETIFSAYLLEVNAFDQPAVEYGKIKTKEFLSS